MTEGLKCWCGAKATVMNESTDATPAHPACDNHCKELYHPLTTAETVPGFEPETVPAFGIADALERAAQGDDVSAAAILADVDETELLDTATALRSDRDERIKYLANQRDFAGEQALRSLARLKGDIERAEISIRTAMAGGSFHQGNVVLHHQTLIDPVTQGQAFLSLANAVAILTR